MNVYKFMVYTAVLLQAANCWSAPAAVFIIRHGEKELALNPQGQPILIKGKNKYTRYLSLRGWQRAYALSFDSYFFNNPEFGVPVAVFASAPPTPKGSIRPIETITPLADRLNLKVNSQFEPGAQPQLVSYVMNNKAYDGKLIVMAFEHHHIPGLAAAFKATEAPKTWANDVFDRIWEIRFDTKTGAVLSFNDNPQQLLYGDSKN